METIYAEHLSFANEKEIIDFRYECMKLDVTESICEFLHNHKITHKQFARKMGITKGKLNQLLDGSKPITLRFLAQMEYEYNVRMDIKINPKI